MNTLRISVGDGYEIFLYDNKEIRIKTSPVLKKFERVVDFDRRRGEVLLWARFELKNGQVVEDVEPVCLEDVLCWGFDDARKVVRSIEKVEVE